MSLDSDSTEVPGRMVSSLASIVQAIEVGDGHDRAVEVASSLGSGSAAVRLGGEGVQVGAAEAFERGDQVGADALGHKGQARC